jgi:hypothetical protein
VLRNYIELCYIIVNRQIAKAQYIAFFGLSNYEYHADQKKLRELETHFGIHLIFEANLIRFIVTDNDLFQVKFRYCRAFFYRHRYTFQNDQDILLLAYIGKNLLWASDHITVEELADRIGYSRSNLRFVLKKAKELLASYNIHCRIVPYHGFAVEGNEFDIRRCLVAVYSLIDINIIPDGDVEDILAGYRNETYQAIIDCIEKAIVPAGYLLSNIERRRITNYLISQNARIHQGYHLQEFPFVLSEELKNSIVENQLDVARMISTHLYQDLGFGPYDETEVFSIAVLLFLADPDSFRLTFTVRSLWPQRYTKLTSIVSKYFLDVFGFNPLQDQQYEPFFCYSICILVLKGELGMLPNQRMNIGGYAPQVSEYPLISAVRNDLTSLLKKEYQSDVSSSHADPISRNFFYFIQLFELPYQKLDIAIISRNSIAEPIYIRDIITQQVKHDYYRKLDTLRYNDVVSGLCGHYDLVISDTVPQYSTMDAYAYLDDRFRIINFQQLIRSKRDLCQGAKLLHVHRVNLDFKKKNSLKKLQEFLEIDMTLPELRIWFESAMVYHDTIIVFLKKETKANHLVLGPLLNRGRGKNAIHHYLLYYGSIQQHNIRFLNALLHELVFNFEFFSDLLENPSLDLVNQRMNQILE